MTHRLICMLIPMFALAGCGDGDPAPHADSHAEGEHGSRVSLTDAQIAAADIALETAGSATLRETLPVYGSVVPNAERVRQVTARFPGQARTVHKQIGEAVRAGETLATIESNESLQVYSVVAPLSGVITARNINQGEQTGDEALFTIADLSTVWVELALFPRDVPRVKTGQAVRITSADAGLDGDGRIVYVAPFGNATNQTVVARVLIDNATRQWAPGLYVTAHITLGESLAPVAVTAAALQTVDGVPVVFVRTAAGFEPRPLRTGRADGRFVEVLEGIVVGDVYAAQNSFILKSELGKGSAAHAD